MFFILSFVIFFSFIFIGINLPYVGPNAGNYSVYSLIAHNFNHFGYFATKFAPVISISDVLPQNPEYFFHHPTLLSVVESLLFKLFGESFWVGRLTVILFAFGSMVVIFLIAKTLENKKFAILTIFVMSVIPASTLFGKMIGQEPLVLFFCLLILYSVIRFLQSNKKKFFILACLSTIFGILSDWPATYFILFFLPLFIKHKKIKVWIYLLLVSGVTACLLLLYVYLMRGGFWDLQNAAALRSFTGLLDIPFWPVRWLTVTIFRLLLYFNPIFVIVAFFYLYKLIKKKLSDKDMVIMGLFLFGAFHLALYAQASFTHPYLNYYLLPFVTLGCSSIVKTLLSQKKYLYIIPIFVFSLFYLITIQTYKNQQVESNVWRYELAKEVTRYLSPYEYIITNIGTTMDADTLWYPFLINMKGYQGDKATALKTHKHYVFSCLGKCIVGDEELLMLKQTYQSIHILHPKAEVYIFLLQKKKDQHNKKEQETKVVMKTNQPVEKESGLYRSIKDVYRLIQNTLKVPQF